MMLIPISRKQIRGIGKPKRINAVYPKRNGKNTTRRCIALTPYAYIVKINGFFRVWSTT
jgi:hypothetical protein